MRNSLWPLLVSFLNEHRELAREGWEDKLTRFDDWAIAKKTTYHTRAETDAHKRATVRRLAGLTGKDALVVMRELGLNPKAVRQWKEWKALNLEYPGTQKHRRRPVAGELGQLG